eukprot:gnl/TRDRNA2_/TRDRNA2_30677_c0_seq1.p1 gnl/TRDRNA2_/TRDRNA2_30677_c0~~gnl/TRDRNA2_/TRDRNA2_30677_c0_seq1.p1  ORF type:complete len:343 (-),score=49.38 gnl/TRDRNA2_/TRDRNA2_30677_c0_seq1:99-1046(-)
MSASRLAGLAQSTYDRIFSQGGRCSGGERLSAHAGGDSQARIPQTEALEKAVNRFFAQDGGTFATLSFSVTIADPNLDQCPLIGCSTGFCTLCGYEMEEITGRNCRFLVDPVPPELTDNEVRRRAWEFCNAVKEGRDYQIPDEEQEQWMPTGSNGELFCVQWNARKDGSLFRNMFYLRVVRLDGSPYILGLQAEMPSEEKRCSIIPEECQAACELLNTNMNKVEMVLAGTFWCDFPMRRQAHGSDYGFLDDDVEDDNSPGQSSPAMSAPTSVCHAERTQCRATLLQRCGRLCGSMCGSEGSKTSPASSEACKASK